MNLSEIFYSLQGEGKLLGVPSVFIRTGRCNLRCTWCDTPYASWESDGQNQTLAQIMQTLQSHPARHVVITGGEPLLEPELPELVQICKQGGYHITIETAGTLWQDVPLTPRDLLSISPKLANSTPHTRAAGRFARAHDAARINLDILRRWVTSPAEKQWKFVLQTPADLTEVESLLTQIGGINPADVVLMPEGVDAATLAQRTGWLTELCTQRGYRFSPRLHVLLWGNRRGV
jgi:7-carboxy-7-deazaguanine synthase